MPADSTSHSSAFDSFVVGLLACPVCRGGLRLEKSKLICTECGRAYPVVDGIPVLIAGQENPQS